MVVNFKLTKLWLQLNRYEPSVSVDTLLCLKIIITISMTDHYGFENEYSYKIY
jgi:hypothetical protein